MSSTLHQQASHSLAPAEMGALGAACVLALAAYTTTRHFLPIAGPVFAARGRVGRDLLKPHLPAM